jgi:hypothetical protein
MFRFFQSMLRAFQDGMRLSAIAEAYEYTPERLWPALQAAVEEMSREPAEAEAQAEPSAELEPVAA